MSDNFILNEVEQIGNDLKLINYTNVEFGWIGGMLPDVILNNLLSSIIMSHMEWTVKHINSYKQERLAKQ